MLLIPILCSDKDGRHGFGGCIGGGFCIKSGSQRMAVEGCRADRGNEKGLEKVTHVWEALFGKNFQMRLGAISV